MRWHDVGCPPHSRRSPKRKGRGIGSGHGKTAGRGHKGQKARSGAHIRPGFEGGQMPLQRRLPKRGFRNPLRREPAAVNVGKLERFPEGAVVTPEALREAGVIGSARGGVKILGEGRLSKALVVRAHRFSRSAQEKIQAAGGRAEVIE
ncbi:MAG: 50S ribosomal protein L15 [Acetobacteraceae bacterium]|nr:50S ribosomal protein L15 [Acetobacteraceae bacterium]